MDRSPSRRSLGAFSKLKGRLSSQLGYFGDVDRLLVIAHDATKPAAAELALAHGLAHAGDRDLWVALPAAHAGPALRRAAFLDRTIRVWTYQDDSLGERMIPARAEVLALYQEPVLPTTATLGPQTDWIADLVEWAETCPFLVSAHRAGYLAWKCDGRLVLKVRPASGDVLVVSAGLHNKAKDACTLVLQAPATTPQTAELIAAANAACLERLAGTDAGNLA